MSLSLSETSVIDEIAAQKMVRGAHQVLVIQAVHDHIRGKTDDYQLSRVLRVIFNNVKKNLTQEEREWAAAELAKRRFENNPEIGA